MTTLYLRLPSRAVSGGAPHWSGLPCAYALASHGKQPQAISIERQGEMPLPGLSGAIAGAQRVVIILAAADVALLRVKVPPLSYARLKAALPNLVEDQLIGDPSGCVIAAGGAHEGMRTVAVVQRAWLEHLAKTLNALGARRIAALPAQLCLPDPAEQAGRPGDLTAAINVQETGIDLTLRLPGQDGIGLTIAPARVYPEQPEDQAGGPRQTAAHEVIRALRAVARGAPLALYVPQAEIPAYQQAADDTGAQGGRISVLADNWAHWIAGAGSAAPDLMAGLGAAGPGFDWRAWRWPLSLAAATMIINIAALNIDWWRMKTEAGSLRAAMTRIYQAAYPKETVIIDPAAQMQQKIAAARRDAGLPLPDDFVALAAAFGEAWGGAMRGKPAPAIAALEYRERGLIVQLKPVSAQEDGAEIAALEQQIKTALAERGLSLELGAPGRDSAQGAAVTWHIRSMK